MKIVSLRKALTLPMTQSSRSGVRFWLGLSLLFALICGGLALWYGFREGYVVDSDARQHVFWMQRFSDPTLFPEDLITDYHQSVAPPGYAALYWLANAVGISPFVFNKLLPAILGLIATGYCFFTCLELLPVPAAGFVSALLLNQALWVRYDLVSGTPRSFVYPLFLAFLYYLLRRQIVPCLVTIALLGLFYPQCLFVAAALLLLYPWRWQNGKLRIAHDRQDYILCIAGLVVAFLVMLPYALQSSEFGPAVSLADARVSPEFLPGGRTPFFHANVWEFWLYGKRSGILPEPEDMPPLIWLGWLLPLVTIGRLPLTQHLTAKTTVLLRAGLASLGMFFIAHALLFKLHLPSRYTMHTLPILLALAAGMTLIILLDALLQWIEQHPSSHSQHWLGWTIATGLGLILILYPAFVGFPFTKYKQGEVPELYAFLAQQPKDTLVASLSKEANNLPTFAQRSVLTSEMYAIPYQVGYYRQIRQRTLDVLRAQYSPNLADVQQMIRQYGIDFWLLDSDAFSPNYIASNNWLMQFQPAKDAIAHLQQGGTSALSGVRDRCSVLNVQEFVLLKADCILQ